MKYWKCIHSIYFYHSDILIVLLGYLFEIILLNIHDSYRVDCIVFFDLTHLVTRLLPLHLIQLSNNYLLTWKLFCLKFWLILHIYNFVSLFGRLFGWYTLSTKLILLRRIAILTWKVMRSKHETIIWRVSIT